MPGSIEVLCQISYAVKQGFVRPCDALICIPQVTFTAMVSRSRTADLTVAEKHL